jgi:AraC family transcriptional regulator
LISWGEVRLQVSIAARRRGEDRRATQGLVQNGYNGAVGTGVSQGTSPNCFYGRTLRSRSEQHFHLAERAYPSGYRTPKHLHSKPLICMVLDGGYYETHGSKTRYCTPSTLLFHAAEEDHLEQFGACGGRSLVVEIEPAWLARAQEFCGISLDATAAFDGGALSPLGARLYKEFLSDDDASRLVIEGILFEMAGELTRASTPREQRPPRWLEQSRELVREGYANPLSLGEIAESVGVHPVHLAQAFRKFYHCTVGDHVRNLRVDFACRQLRTTEIPLSEIALLAGFADQSHFTRTFKQLVGIPPLQYRQLASAGVDLPFQRMKR